MATGIEHLNKALATQRHYQHKMLGGGALPYPDREGSSAPPARWSKDRGMEMHPANLNKGDTERASLKVGRGHPHVGLIRSAVPGRTDRLPLHVWEDSYVVPADVVSGWGQGNTEAGARILDAMQQGHARQGGMAAGGRVALHRVPIVAAGGEYIFHPHAVRSMGGGDMAKGHRVLDKMVRTKRMSTARRMQNLPGPRRD